MTVSIKIIGSSTTITSSTVALAAPAPSASVVTFAPYGTITATNVEEALQQLADQDFRSTSAPTGTNVSEGDMWYDTDDNIYKIYRETSAGVFEWTNVVVAEPNTTLDAGTF